MGFVLYVFYHNKIKWYYPLLLYFLNNNPYMTLYDITLFYLFIYLLIYLFMNSQAPPAKCKIHRDGGFVSLL